MGLALGCPDSLPVGSGTWSQEGLLGVQPYTGQHARLSNPSGLAREPLQGFAGPQIPAATRLGLLLSQ